MLRILLLAILLLALAPGLCFAWRCGNKLVSIHDTSDEVRHKCGEPQSIEAWTEHRIKGYRYPYDYTPQSDRYYGKHNPYAVTVDINIEEWTYNLGPSRFLRYLRFENGRLKRIETGEYGY